MCLTPRLYIPNETNNIDTLDCLAEYSDNCDYVSVEETKEGIEYSSLACIQWNVRGLISKQSDISKFLQTCGGSKQIDLVIISESWLTKDNIKKVNIPGYSYVGNNRPSRRGGGVGLLIHNNLEFKIRKDLHIDSAIMENISIDIKLGNRTYTACSIYRPPNTDATEFNNLFLDYMHNHSTMTNSREIIIGLDHNLDFLNRNSHENTQKFIENILDQDLIPVITKPTRITRSCATLIDNILLSKTLCSSEQCCIIENDLSDHLPSMVVIPNVYNKKGVPLEFITRSITPAKLNELNSELCNNLKILDVENHTVDEIFDDFHEQLITIIDDICPEKLISIPANRAIRDPWMNPGVRKCSSQQLKLYRDFLHQRTPESESKYKSYRKVLKKLKRYCKVQYYHQKCTEYRSNTKKLWNIINEVRGKNTDKTTIISCLKIDSIKQYESKKIGDHLGNYYANVGMQYANKIPLSKKSIDDYVGNIQHEPNSIYFKPCTNSELITIISKLPNKSSSGFDRISNKLLKGIAETIVPFLTVIFNESLVKGTFPQRMKHAEVVSLFKKGDRCSVINYWPISLLMTISKLLEKVVYSRTYDFLNHNNSLYASQYGFRKKHSCEHAVMDLVGHVVKALENREYTIAVFLDLSKAF